MGKNIDEFLTPTEHQLIDHTGLSGVAIFFADPGITLTELNTALQNYDIVYLRPGQYNYSSVDYNVDGPIEVPTGKRLEGLGFGGDALGGAFTGYNFGKTEIRITGGLTVNAVNLYETAQIKNIHFSIGNNLAAAGLALIDATVETSVNGATHHENVIEGVSNNAWWSAGANTAVVKIISGIIRHCIFRGDNQSIGVHCQIKSGTDRFPLEICHSRISKSTATPIIQIDPAIWEYRLNIHHNHLSCQGTAHAISLVGGTDVRDIRIEDNYIDSGSNQPAINDFAGSGHGVVIRRNYFQMDPAINVHNLGVATGSQRAEFSHNTQFGGVMNATPASWFETGNRTST